MKHQTLIYNETFTLYIAPVFIFVSPASSNTTGTLFYVTTCITLHSDRFAWQQAEWRSPLFHTAVSLVYALQFTKQLSILGFYLPCFEEAVESLYTVSHTRVTSNEHVIQCMSDWKDCRILSNKTIFCFSFHIKALQHIVRNFNYHWKHRVIHKFHKTRHKLPRCKFYVMHNGNVLIFCI